MTVKSKRIEAFEKVAEKDPRAALEQLRADLRAAQGPLIEPVEGDGVLVTFVWIGTDRRVSVRGTQFPDPRVPSHPMTLVEGTDVWYWSTVTPADVTTVYQYLVDDPSLTGQTQDLVELMRAQAERSYADPFNPAQIYPQLSVIVGDYDAPEERWESVLDLPKAEPAGWFDDADAPAGALIEHRLVSRALDNERMVTVYTPPGYTSTGEPYPLVILLDGECWSKVARLHIGLDNLIAAGRITPPVVAFVHNAPSSNPMSSRNAEMECNPALVIMLADELLPMLRESYHVVSDPARTVVGGTSLAGVAAAHAAFERPEAFGAVLSCSGAHWWGYADVGHPAAWFVSGKDGEPEWLTRQYAAAPLKPIRFWIDVGRLEVGEHPLAPGVDQRAANRHLRTVLRAKGYDVTYHEAPGGHEYATFRRSVAKGLQVLLDPATG